MSEKKVWFITGAGRGLGVDIAKAALAAGHAVVAAARRTDNVTAALGEHDDLLVVDLDVTDPAAASAAVDAAVERFGRIDVLVNNAGNFKAGLFEEIAPEDFRAQIETNLFGPANVTRAILPAMRALRSGLVVTISSTAGLVGMEFCTAYAASKFGVEGWMEALTPEVAPYGIRTMLVEPGFFRTELLKPQSTQFAAFVDRRLRRADRTDRRRLEEHGRPAGRRPGQARERAGPARRSARAAAALRRRRRCSGRRRDEGQRPARPGPRPPRSVQQPRDRRRLT
jgi:NAD(P)-dependent dehydrogenase (short-subunit alcohol dehydrogenase family)